MSDDLHWADSATLLALRWITQRLTAAPVLLVATLRSAPRSPELAQLVDDASHLATTVHLEALSDDEVQALVAAQLRTAPGPELA